MDDARSTLRIRLSSLLRPDYLPLIAAHHWGLAGAHGISIILDEPVECQDGLVALERGACDLILTEPLHLLERARGCESIGRLLKRTGGVLLREDRIGKLRAGEKLRVASPISGALPDRLCRRILQAWAGNWGLAVAETQITIEPAGFRHLENLQAGFDAAWLAFANIEEVSARQRGLAIRLLTAEEAGLPDFSALELVARRNRRAEEARTHETLISVLEMATRQLRADPRRAEVLWREASGEDSEEATRTIEATLPCLQLPIGRAPNRRRALQAILQDA